MKFSRSYKKKGQKQPPAATLLALALLTTALSAVAGYAQIRASDPLRQPVAGAGTNAPALSLSTNHVLASTTTRNKSGSLRPSPPPTMILPPPPPPALSFTHFGIISTFFWVGEKADGDNGGISNTTSTWDGQWMQHYGGIDEPSKHSGYLPSSFTPKENPFYFALPYSDITDGGDRKANASNCPLYTAHKQLPYSWCKNSWIAIRHGGKVVYAQWEDAGPFGENDSAYVFGGSKPANKDGEKAGLDVSPAVRDYLSLQDVDSCDWAFIPASSVPNGPWKQIITTTAGEAVN